MTPTRRYYANGAPTLTTSGSITSGATSVTVATNFTGYPTSFPYYACLDKGTVSQEIVLVTNVVGSVATITRGQDGTLGVSHPAGATVDFVAVAKDFDEANAHTSATAGVHGVAGNVVGDTDTQTLTNKSLTSPTITGSPTIGGKGPATSYNSTGVVIARSLGDSATFTAQSSVGGSASFGVTYASAPVVVITLRSSNKVIFTVGSITTTGFSYTAFTADGTNLSAIVSFMWIAIG